MKNVILGLLVLITGTAASLADEHAGGRELTVRTVAPRVSLLSGYGNNLVFMSSGGPVVIDTHLPNAVPDFMAKLRSIVGNQKVRYVINTHWHPDHIGANAKLQEEAVIVAHDSTRAHMSVHQSIPHFGAEFDAWAPAYLPELTFNDRLTLHAGNDVIELLHFNKAHTDSDIVAILPSAKLAALGDIYIADTYPFVDMHNGGDVLAQLDAFKALADRIPDDYVVVPGHGDVKTGADLKTYRDFLDACVAHVRAGMEQGLDLARLQSRGLPEAYESYSHGPYVTTAQFVEFIYKALRD